jgi:phage/plasmid-associated DNA primase
MMNNTKIIKDLTSGQDLISYEIKHKGHFEDVNYAKIIMASNSLPSSNDTSDGWFRRWMIIQFPNEFDVEKDILSEIQESEYEALVRKVIDIIPKLIQNGAFSSKDTIQQRKETYILNSNPLSLFIQQCCNKDASIYCSYNELYTKYVGYLLKFKKRKVKNKEFKSALEDEGFFVERTTKTINGQYITGYWIIGLDLNYVNYATYVTDSTLSHYIENNGKSMYNMHNLHKNEEFIQDNSISVWEFDKKLINYIKCSVDGCTETEINFDKKNIPYCEKHWDKMAN